MNRDVESASKAKGALWRLIREFAFAYPGRTVGIVFSYLAAGVLEGFSVAAFLPLLATASDFGAGNSPAETMVRNGLAAVGLSPSPSILISIIVAGMLFKAAVMLAATVQVGYSVAAVTADLRHRFTQAIVCARWEFFVDRSVGGFANTISSEAERAGRAYESICQMAALFVQALVYLALTLFVSWKIALAALAAGGLLIAVLARLIRLSRQVGYQQTRLMESMNARIADGLSGMKPLKAMARENTISAFLHDAVEGLNRAAQRALLYRQALATLAEPIIVVFLGIGVLLGSIIFSVPLTTQIIMGLLFFRLVTRIGNIQQHWQNVVIAESAFWSMHSSIAAAEAEREVRAVGSRPPLPAAITVEQVSFAHGDRVVLDNVNLVLNPGEITTVIGPSGAGKTTLADLIVGLRRPTSGRICIGETDLVDVDVEYWRSHIGYVPQELFLFNHTLRENVTLGDNTISTPRVIEALKQAEAWDFIEQLPEGLESIVGTAGTRLSGGQRQRIAIARALVRQPALLILDEATSALDPVSEAGICATVRKLAQNLIVLAITHQPAWSAVATALYRI
ncbi:MAG TPA: ABC transporter ATP-binding protein, partial [Lacipirellulaceae bacterium]|nr:ABC transporter ATP-binding protein [Lacipirellulaceae bacterium]